MTQVVLTEEELEFGDMNGPIAYWGPVTASPTAGLTATERALLLKLAARLERGPAADLSETLTTLLTTPVAAA